MRPNRRAPSSSWRCEKSRSNAVTLKSSRYPGRQASASAPATARSPAMSVPIFAAGAGRQLRATAEAGRQACGCPPFRASGAAASQRAAMSPPTGEAFGRAESALPNKLTAQTPSLSLRLSVFASGENAHHLPTTHPARIQTWWAPVCFVGRWWVSVTAAGRPLPTSNTALPTLDPPSPTTAYQEHTA
jgi:hypothetical protein